MFKTLLIANRAEIACRIIRTARAMGLTTVAVYSDADRSALHVEQADMAVRIGSASATDSYLNIDAILDAARETGADAIHPGYGFLSENAEFAERCVRAGLTFVGPPAAAIRAMGLKDEAKGLLEGAGVPVVPGYHGARQDGPFLRGKATEIGYPVLIKAVAGGGGKGMRRVDQDEDFTSALTSARREALNAFGDDRVLVEKFVETPRHIEIQVMADMRGTTLHLFERDCSIQRRHQKIVEEAPAPGMTDGLRARMGAAAVQTAEAVGYAGAGTVEFIVPGNAPLSDDTPFYFMEMNTRLQVEHPVTEMVTGLDLVALQLRAAAGQRLDLAQDDVRLDGHAIEVRLYAEDPDNGFLPSSGQLDALEIPEGVGIRVDSGVREGDHVSPFYDPMVAKIIAHGRTRGAALDRLSDCLADTLIAGPKTNLMLLQEIVAHGGFGAGPVDTGFLDRELDALIPDAVPQRRTVAAELALDLIAQDQARVAAQVKGRSTMDHDPWNAADGFALGTVSSGMERSHGLVLIIDGRNETVTVEWPVDGPRITDPVADDAVSLSVVEADTALYGLVGGRQFRVTPPDYGRTGGGSSAGGTISAPMHGKVLAIAVTPGDTVEAGDPVATVEAMKMEHGLTAPRAGVVAVVHAAEGDQVGEGQALVSLEEPAAAA